MLFCVIKGTLLSSQTITLNPVGNVRIDSIPIQVEHYTQATTTGAITKITSNIPTDRGRTGLTQIWNTANSDQGNLTVNYPTGYGYVVGTTTYTNATLHANAWWALGTSTYNSYASSASAPNVPTVHFTSVNNSNTDNNMSWAGTETYYDTSVNDTVFRIRYEGSYKYNVSGINTKIDLYFFKSDWTKCYVVLRDYLADGSNIEQIGLSNGSSWLASKINGFTSGDCYELTSSATIAQWVNQGTKYTDSTGDVTFANTSNLQYRVTLPSLNDTINTNNMNYVASRVLCPDSITGLDWYLADMNNDNSINVKDLLFFNVITPVYGYLTQTEYTAISSTNNNLKSTYSPRSSGTVVNENTFYVGILSYPPKTYKQVNELE